MAFEWTEITYLERMAGNTGMVVVGFSVVFVFLVLAALYESWSLPLAVILVLPMCVLSSLAGVAWAKMDINVFTQIGFVVLIGLASKNAILIVEFAKMKRDSGSRRLSCRAGSLPNCDCGPILMTSFAFILGVLPLVVAHGRGAEMRRTLGTAVFSGMLGVTFFGIFLTPVFFLVIDRLTNRLLLKHPALRWLSRAAMETLRLGFLRRPARWVAVRMAASGKRPAMKADVPTSHIQQRLANEPPNTSTPHARAPKIPAPARHESIASPHVLTLFHRSADLRQRAVDRSHAGRGPRAVYVAGHAVPRDYAADGRSFGRVSRRQCRSGGRHRGRADRAAGQRRREHALHVEPMHQRRHLHTDGHVPPGMDLNLAQIMVQNRSSLAEPILPDLVKRRGVVVKKKSPTVLMIVNLFSPEGSRDNLYLSNYATIQLRDELSRLPGVGDISFMGRRDYSMRIWLDPNAMAIRNLSAADVVRAIEQQNVQVAAGQIGQPPRPTARCFNTR